MVDCICCQFLSGSRFSIDQNRCIRIRAYVDPLFQLFNRLAFAQDVLYPIFHISAAVYFIKKLFDIDFKVQIMI